MIQANELRIGNWVQDGSDRVVRVESITRDTAMLAFVVEDNFTLLSEVTGLPINSEILLSCGFTAAEPTDHYGGFLSKEILTVQPYTTSQIRIRIDNFGFYYESSSIVRITYVHQLQNLYFALTGKELEIKL